MVHFITVFLLAAFFRRLLEIYRKEQRVVLEWKVYLKKVFPSGKYCYDTKIITIPKFNQLLQFGNLKIVCVLFSQILLKINSNTTLKI